jgi:DNA (cytosine-5)-methyltransferase 1
MRCAISGSRWSSLFSITGPPRSRPIRGTIQRRGTTARTSQLSNRYIAVPEGYLDLLMASPTCTHHSVARGGKPTSDQQRSDPWHVITWFTQLRVKRAIIENVPEFVGWGPVDRRSSAAEIPQGRILPPVGGDHRRPWRHVRIQDPELRRLRRRDHPARFFGMIRFDKRKIYWPARVACRSARTGARADPWPEAMATGARHHRLGDQGPVDLQQEEGSLAEDAGADLCRRVKFKWPEPFLVILRNHMDGQSVDGPLPAVTAGGTAHRPRRAGDHERSEGQQAQGVSPAPLPTLDTKGGVWLAEPVADPFVLSQQTSGAPRSTDEPLPAITTGGAGTDERPGCARHMVVEPFILPQGGGWRGARTQASQRLRSQPTALTR